MLDPRFIDEFAERMLGLLPPGAAELKEDLEKNFRATLQTMFARMDLVTREEFDVQAAVLLRTREQLEALEKRVDALEKQARGSAAAKQTKTGKKPQAKKKTQTRRPAD
jgi:BMFP domain-containing protein YqiC